MAITALNSPDFGDLVALERSVPAAVLDRRTDIRVITSIPGRYLLGSRRDERGNRREFACRALNMSARAMLLAAPVSGPQGERVIAHFDQFGRLEGSIIRVLSRGFVMSISATEAERLRLAARLAWLEDHKNHDAHEARKHERVVPRNPYSWVTLADGSTETCFIIDMSASGAAVSADVKPEIGTVLAIGRVIGRVRRHLAEGFAVEFIQMQSIDALPALLLRR
ncbi:PilZ domain-containing protein [Xanthobacteraceae bacterium Astr-EGSB]|uniref:PilZ domain-containing protein n=1 Tax=Astrobacterium formosum TaxID=3069710 RepID=UPI0027AE813B|nr:PilZ domain-containing protein [Xanthobacteraceae bacterium Astr-EGSB]